MNHLEKKLAPLNLPGYEFAQIMASQFKQFGIEERAEKYLDEHPEATRSDIILWVSDQPEFLEYSEED